MLGSRKVRQKKGKRKSLLATFLLIKTLQNSCLDLGQSSTLVYFLSVNSLVIIQGVSNLLFTCLHLTT